jgi:hypothetical protein
VVREGCTVTRSSVKCLAGPEDDESTTRLKTRWSKEKKTAFAPLIAGYLKSIPSAGIDLAMRRRWSCARTVKGTARQHHDGILSDSGRRCTCALPACLRPPLLRVCRFGCCTGRSATAPQSLPPVAGGPGRVGGGRTMAHLHIPPVAGGPGRVGGGGLIRLQHIYIF